MDVDRAQFVRAMRCDADNLADSLPLSELAEVLDRRKTAVTKVVFLLAKDPVHEHGGDVALSNVIIGSPRRPSTCR